MGSYGLFVVPRPSTPIIHPIVYYGECGVYRTTSTSSTQHQLETLVSNIYWNSIIDGNTDAWCYVRMLSSILSESPSYGYQIAQLKRSYRPRGVPSYQCNNWLALCTME